MAAKNQAMDRQNRTARQGSQRGFTLIELMVVVVIVGILAAIGVPMYGNYVLKGNLNRALPAMMAIAAKERVHFNRTGYYLATGYEQQLQQKLGLDLHDVGDFCFMVFCTAAAGFQCGTYGEHDGTAAYASTIPANADFGTLIDTVDKSKVQRQFQVVAVLRMQGATAADDPLLVDGAGQTCHVSDHVAKTRPEGWVDAANTKGGQGRVVLLSYPQPIDGTVTNVTIGGHTSNIEWFEGISITDAFTD